MESWISEPTSGTLGVCGVPGVLLILCSVSVLESVFVIVPSAPGMLFARVSRRGGAVPRSAAPPAQGGLSFVTGPGRGGDLGFPCDGLLGCVGAREFQAGFLRAPGVALTAGMVRVCNAARAAALAAAASASSDDDAVTWEDVMERIVWRETAVKDSSSAVTRAWLRRRSAQAAAWLRSTAAALAWTSWGSMSIAVVGPGTT